MHWPGTVEIGTGIAADRRSSYTFLQAIFHEGECAATGRATMVMIERATRKARPLPEDVIARLEGCGCATVALSSTKRIQHG